MAIVTQSDTTAMGGASDHGQVLIWYIDFRDKLRQLQKSNMGRGFDLDNESITRCAITAAENYASMQKSQAFEIEMGRKPTPVQESQRFKHIIVPFDGTKSEKDAIARVARYCILTQDAELRRKEKQEWQAAKAARIEAHFAPSKGLYPEIGGACAVGVGSVGVYSAIAGISLVAALSGPVGIGLLVGVAILAFCAIQVGKYWQFKTVLSQEAESEDKALAKVEKAVEEIEEGLFDKLYQKNLSKFNSEVPALSLSDHSKKSIQAAVVAKYIASKRAKSLPVDLEEHKVPASEKRSASHGSQQNDEKPRHGVRH